MDKRLEDAIQDLIYWRNAYVHSRKRFRETGDPKYEARMSINLVHILSKAEWIKIVYQEETGNEVTTRGNLPRVEDLNERSL